MAWLRFWLIDTFITEVGERDAAEEGPAEIARQPRTVARALEDRYLLRAQAGAAATQRLYQLISDRIIEPIRQAADGQAAPEDPGLYLAAAERALTAGKFRLAEKYAATVLETAPDTALRWHAEAYSLLGNLSYRQAHFDTAEERYQRAAELFEAANDRAAVVRLLAAISRTLVDRGRFRGRADPAERGAQSRHGRYHRHPVRAQLGHYRADPALLRGTAMGHLIRLTVFCAATRGYRGSSWYADGPGRGYGCER